MINFTDSYNKLGSDFSVTNNPSPLKAPKLITWNNELADFLNLTKLNNKLDIFSGNKVAPSSTPISTAYAGHQFGHFVPQLGDGRVHLLGELKAQDNESYEVQLKGSGPTPFSRGGDGRSPLGPVIREYLVSEFMNSLTVPTSRSLSIIASGEDVYREDALAGGILCRVAKSHIRIGTFQYFAYRGQIENLKKLSDFVINKVDQNFQNSQDPYFSYFDWLVEKQAQLVAQWMSLGFIHGVMNTDNTSAIGITIDYGPCAFLDESDFNKVFSSIDRRGRYAYNKQPSILKWNLERLAESLILLYPNREKASEKYKEKIKSFMEIFTLEWEKIMLKKIGLSPSNESFNILSLFLDYISSHKLDFTLSFRNLSSLIKGDKSFYISDSSFGDFLSKWKIVVLKNHEGKTEDLINLLNNTNPLYVPRNHIIEEVIKNSYAGDYSGLNEVLQLIKNPFEPNLDLDKKYLLPPNEEEKVTQTFCGT